MKKKSDLGIMAIALVSILFIVFVFAAASASKSDMQESMEKIIVPDEEVITQEKETTEGDKELIPEEIYKDGAFAFTVDEFAECFSGSLPAGYIFTNEMEVNPQRDNWMQLDILEENGTATDVAIIFNKKETDPAFNQMALVIKEGSYDADAAASLRWYISTFLKDFEEEKTAIYEDYLNIFLNGTEDYKVYAEESLMVMMCCETEKNENYYYVLLTVQ